MLSARALLSMMFRRCWMSFSSSCLWNFCFHRCSVRRLMPLFERLAVILLSDLPVKCHRPAISLKWLANLCQGFRKLGSRDMVMLQGLQRRRSINMVCVLCFEITCRSYVVCLRVNLLHKGQLISTSCFCQFFKYCLMDRAVSSKIIMCYVGEPFACSWGAN